MQGIVPILRYTDARAAIRWLDQAFGFVELFSVPDTGPFVRHAQLQFGGHVIMLGSTRDDGLQSPGEVGCVTQAVYVYVAELERHFQRAQAAGADIVSPLQGTDHGSREYHARDLEGHLWVFGSYRPGVS